MFRFLILVVLTFTTMCSLHAREPVSQLIKRWPAPEAVQGVAVDDSAFYAIGNSVIGKYDKTTGKRTAGWSASDELPLRHLNAGVVLNGQLYCAHSNFPDYPSTSSVEIFSTSTLEHVGSHSLGIYEGSLTWVDWHEDAWWCVFAHYSEKVNDDPRALPHTYTSLVRFDKEWRRTAGWVFPKAVLDRFDPHSCSGGGFTSDGRLIVTGHDLGEAYELALPQSGSELKLIGIVELEITGQGIAFDRSQPGIVYGINRPRQEVVVLKLMRD